MAKRFISVAMEFMSGSTGNRKGANSMIDNINNQVYIGLDGELGVVIQTSAQAYQEYYRRLGYELLGYAQPLPFELVTVIKPMIKRAIQKRLI